MTTSATASLWRYSLIIGIAIAAGVLIAVAPSIFKEPLSPITEDQVLWNEWTENFKPQILAQLNALQADKPECRDGIDLADIAVIDNDAPMTGEKTFFAYCFSDAKRSAFSQFTFPLYGPAKLKRKFP